MNLRCDPLRVSYDTQGKARYSLELWHDGLRRHRVIRGSEREMVIRTAELQKAHWDEQWAGVNVRKQQSAARALKQGIFFDPKADAAERADQAAAELESLQRLLTDALSAKRVVDLDALKHRANFSEPDPVAAPVGPAPEMPLLPPEPKPTDMAYQPTFGNLDLLIPSRKRARIAEALERYRQNHVSWSVACEAAYESHATACRKYLAEVARKQSEHAANVAKWEARRQDFLNQQAVHNAAVDAKREAYFAMDPEAVAEHCELALSASVYPAFVRHEFELQYEPSTRRLVAYYFLPGPDDLPTLKSVKYVASRNAFEEQHLSEAALAKVYDAVVYQIVLRTVHELFDADAAGALGTIVLNGMVTAVDRGTGNPVTNCVVSLQVARDTFSTVNLAQVEPKACFKALRGVGSSKLHGLSAVAPILAFNRDDRRFVLSHDVVATLDSGVNLAAMDWEEFEHLIREVFEKEFSTTGGEVKVTQASRDGGVDAIAFDPDPIRGGKIVIQAKRYTNTVGVSAVRDLYGTVLNEGAIKGILVTTSDYGPDSYTFVQGKPLTLLSGANLLHILAKHGIGARINIREAKLQAQK